MAWTRSMARVKALLPAKGPQERLALGQVMSRRKPSNMMLATQKVAQQLQQLQADFSRRKMGQSPVIKIQLQLLIHEQLSN